LQVRGGIAAGRAGSLHRVSAEGQAGAPAAIAQDAPAPPPPVYWEARAELAARLLQGEGLEIGPLHQPLAMPPQARVRYVDRMLTPDLRREYPELATWDLTDVDIVDDGEKLATIAEESQDFIVANHFLEHTEDPMGTIETHLGKLRPGGILFYAVPDKRYTFDFRREVTPLQHMVDDHEQGPERSRATHYDEWTRLVVAEKYEGEEQALAGARKLEAEAYSIHMHVWTQAEFLQMILALRERLDAAFDIEAAAHKEIEFIVVLRKSGAFPSPPGADYVPTPPVPPASELERWKSRARKVLHLVRSDIRRWRERP
jgi:predicted SAM-dependent methyltransferase